MDQIKKYLALFVVMMSLSAYGFAASVDGTTVSLDDGGPPVDVGNQTAAISAAIANGTFGTLVGNAAGVSSRLAAAIVAYAASQNPSQAGELVVDALAGLEAAGQTGASALIAGTAASLSGVSETSVANAVANAPGLSETTKTSVAAVIAGSGSGGGGGGGGGGSGSGSGGGSASPIGSQNV